MKHILVTVMALASFAVAGAGVIRIKSSVDADSVYVQHLPVTDWVDVQFENDPRILRDTLMSAGGKIEIAVPDGEARYYYIYGPGMAGEYVDVFASPADEIAVDVSSGSYNVTGTPLMESISDLHRTADVYQRQLAQIQPSSQPTPEMIALYRKWRDAYADYARNNPNNPAAVYALQNADVEVVNEFFDTLGPGARNSVLSPLYDYYKDRITGYRAFLERSKRVGEGSEAPAFVLPDLGGQYISLESLRGKWVLLDFWGTWCPWCIKGFPQMKEYYAKYSDVCYFVGIACRDSKEKWMNAVRRYELPWINLWSDPDASQADAVETRYAVQGFPTKMLIDPEGKIAKVCVGEDPSFYDSFPRLMGK